MKSFKVLFNGSIFDERVDENFHFYDS